MTSDRYSSGEKYALWAVLCVAFAGLGYAMLLVGQVRNADQGTPKMQKVAAAIRAGAEAYLGQQFSKIIVLIGVLTVALFFTALAGTSEAKYPVAFGRAGAFLMGSLFSFAVGFVGMRFATLGNLRVAAAARNSFGGALQVGYRTGTITGMLTDGLGLLGGTLIFMAYGEKAYEVLLGFGFGGTLIALFMRVGGGIYTKAADVGADLVGKVEKDIPEDDPRNAATIADNVGDNVGDCAGMAADIFESYEVTIVAAMILGYASFGHKGVIFPLLVRAIGVIGSIISTYSVRSKEGDSGDAALDSVHRGFLIGSVISVVGFFLVGLFYLKFDAGYFMQYHQALAGYPITNGLADLSKLPVWANLGQASLDLRPAWTCLIGVFLAVALNKCTSYFTHTTHAPVKSMAKACQTGHATNIIQGFAVGYESTVWAVIIIAIAVGASVTIYSGTSPIFVAYGVAMCGIGMLTLTGNTISMDVFGPVADNANGIGEMGYDKAEMGEEKYKKARQILADLDSVGNTTKAETKGIAIGSAVIAAVSLFASFIAVMAMGSEEKISEMTTAQYNNVAGMLTVANPTLFIGLLIGGAVPFLFSSMTIRAVGRAAFLIVKECRLQFRDKEIWAGTKTPDYARVVGICTSAAQKELIGPGLLAIMAPLAVGFLLGPLALAGFLAGMILVGQLLAVFMANAGGAWDNAKKLIEDEPRDLARNTGKGSERHKAAVTGDTVGDPLKDTAGPAINPLIKVMNMVSLLLLPIVLKFHAVGGVEGTGQSSYGIAVVIAVLALAAIAWAVNKSKTDSPEMAEMEKEFETA
ncbi:MAG TPA: sodium-translocating pyrophosphatase [Verrucomicrobiae bacterium]|nr:sodium-translocating pyrophosphatase [Verrucomicrobiae bacterium]